jgi:hypothetical protein
VVFHVINMPLTWIHNLPKGEAEKLAVELGVPVDGTLDDLRKRLKEKWRLMENYLPPQFTAKSEVGMNTAGSSVNTVQNSDVHGHVSYSQIKLRGKVVTDLVKNIPVLSDTEPESVFRFLVGAKEVYDLNFVTEVEFLALMVARTTGRVTQIISVHLGTSSKWGSVCSEILSTFLPPRIREGFLSKYVLDRFQSATEELSQFIMSVVAAADILGYEVPESVLVHRMVQNIHPHVRSQLVFASKPTSIRELYSLASQVAEGRAIDDRREISERQVPSGNSQHARRESRTVSFAVGQTRRSTSRAVRCWKCSGKGQVRKDCPSSDVSVTRNRGNEGGARQ